MPTCFRTPAKTPMADDLILEYLKSPSPSHEVLRVLFDARQVEATEHQRMEFDRAMADAQAEMQPVLRDGINRERNSRHARLEAIDAAIRPIYTRHGFALTFDNPEESDAAITVICTVSHSGGYQKSFRLAGGRDDRGLKETVNKTPIQAVGSTVSYLRRYLTCMVFNVTMTNDDIDGNIPAPISVAQWRELQDLVTETATDMPKFLAYLRVPDLAELPAAAFQQAKVALMRKMEQKP